MNPQLQLLIELNDVELLLREANEQRGQEKKLGFPLSEEKRKELLKRREADRARIDPVLLSRFDRTWARLGRAVAPVLDGICCGCFERLPTAAASDLVRNEAVQTCENCGRFLYWIV